jgi:hypothetical protein
MTSTLTIRAPKPGEAPQVMQFIRSMYRQYGFCNCLDAEELTIPMLIAVESGNIVGTVGLYSAADGELPIEYYFGFKSEEQCDYRRDQVVEICKLVSSSENASNSILVIKSLVAAICQYSFQASDLQLAYVSQKPLITRLMQRFLHISLYPLDFQVVEEKITDYNAGYFLNTPRPVPLEIHADDMRTVFHKLKQDIEKRVSIDLQNFSHRL